MQMQGLRTKGISQDHRTSITLGMDPGMQLLLFLPVQLEEAVHIPVQGTWKAQLLIRARPE